MISGKQKMSWKRILAGVLSVAMVLSTAQLPAGTAYAKEAAVTALENGNASGMSGETDADESVQKNEPASGEDSSSIELQEPGEEEETPDTGAQEPGDGEDSSDTEVKEPEEEQDSSDTGTQEPDAGEEPSDTGEQEPDDGENPSDTETQKPADGENPSEDGDTADEAGEEGMNESDANEVRVSGISDNDADSPDSQEIWMEAELDGAYQFGGSPAAKGNLSVYGETAYSSEAEEYLYQQIRKRSKMIDISAYKLDVSGVRSLINGVLNEHPDLYFAERGYNYYLGSEYTAAIELSYNDTYDDAAFQKGVSSALACVDSQMSDLEKAVALHDYLTVNCEYDYENYLAGKIPSESYSAYGTLVNHTAVCQGYALAYKYLLNQVGIDCYMVTSDSMNHAWNMIVLDGQYYQVDVTWDDPVWDKIGRSVHTFMFRSDAAFARHQDWRVTSGSSVVDYRATDTRYDNAFWVDCDSPLVLAGDDCYYITDGGNINKTRLEDITDAGTFVQSIGRWPVWGGSGNWIGAFSGLFQIQDRLYYNDKASIYSIALDGTDKRTEFTADTSTGYIYGSAYCQGKVLYALHQTPNIETKETVLTADIDTGGGEPDDPVIPVENIELSAYILELTEGEEAELTAVVYPQYATESAVIWTSDDEAVAEVSNGTVRALSPGSCTITASAGGKEAECSVQVTAREEDKALNLDNLSYDYTALDDTNISSTAQGRPKLLVFYSNTCGNCRNTIRSISAKIADFAGIDIYALETNDGTKEEVAEFQSQYGCEEITFSYDKDGINRRSMAWYSYTGGMGTIISWPLICYIDANNRLQYMTMSLMAAETILSNLQKYCDASVENPQTYTITYVLNGGTNNSDNPSIYTEKDTVITLRDPVREGFQFEGWYSDAVYSVRVTQIHGADKRDIVLYAKWKSLSVSEQPVINQTPADGNVLMGFSGAYYTETADKILGRLNEIRMEACKEGVNNPDTGSPLTVADYVPLQWSSDLEAIARLRAAEATVSQSHTRPNGQRCFTVVTNNREQSWAENLAWNSSGLMAGIEQWYAEKSDWVNQTGGVVGHYRSIISPSYCSVGVGAFRLSSGGWYAIAQEFSRKDSLDTQKDAGQGNCVQYIEVQGSNVTKVEFGADKAAFIQEGESCRLPVEVTVQYKDYYQNDKAFTGPYQAGGRWKSSDETVATVDSTGEVAAVGKGTVQITMSAGLKSVSTQITVYGAGESPIMVKRPDITTYKVGQKINLKGGTVTYPSDGQTRTAELEDGMISGFDSSKPGVCTVQVTCGGYTANFDTLIVEEPELAASVGQSLRQIALPQNEYGTYTWQDDTVVVEKAGIYTFAALFTPQDEVKFQKLTDIQVQVTAQETLGADTDVAFKVNEFIYNGAAQEPKAVVRVSDTLLTEGQDYKLSYSNNRDAGTATVTIEGAGCYLGSISRDFEIKPAQLVITALDMSIKIGDPVPAPYEYEYTVSGLVAEDTLLAEPAFSCGTTDSTTAGRYDIVPYGADAGTNYSISYRNGRLTVASEYVSCTVSFNVQGHGAAPADIIDVKVGSTIDRPADPEAAGYRFDGWYQDAACTKAWNFEADIVQSDMTLYAKWLDVSENSEFAIQEIADVYYTGKACKPAVSVYDGDMLLKSGRDYQIKYYNNINTNKDGVPKQGNGEGAYFNAELPYAEIIGKGNYTDRIKDGNRNTVKVNFNILRTAIGDGRQTADGIMLKISDQLVMAQKVQNPFTSIKYVKGMKKDIDYKVRLTVENARDQAGRSLRKDEELPGAAVPAGYSGAFLLTVEGIGNYEGSICKEIYVTDKAHLMKNATIVIGKNQKNVTFTGEPIRLNPAEVSTADTFIVKCGTTILRPFRDYTVQYRNHDRVGKAELIITGTGEYAGSKTASFNITGKAFTAKTVLMEDIENKVYTGRAITQNGIALTYDAGDGERRALRHGTDYTISYSRNINKGTATMTFKGMAAAGYSGSFKKTFKITAADIAKVNRPASMEHMVYNYCKAGVKPVEEISLTNQEGIALRNGKDYTLKYVNNKAVAGASDKEPPTVIVRGKGNYTGEFNLYFDIVRTDLRADSIQIRTTPVAYKENRAPDYVYKPAVKLVDGKSALRAGADYEIEYRNNTQADYDSYIQKLRGQAGGSAPQEGELTVEDGVPVAVITEAEGASYRLEQPIIVPLPIYLNKLTKTTLTVYVDEAVYSGSQVTPEVAVFYGGGQIREGEHYTLSYGKNVASGKNKGSVVISGVAPYYGGSVTVKFDIVKKPISY